MLSDLLFMPLWISLASVVLVAINESINAVLYVRYSYRLGCCKA